MTVVELGAEGLVAGVANAKDMPGYRLEQPLQGWHIAVWFWMACRVVGNRRNLEISGDEHQRSDNARSYSTYIACPESREVGTATTDARSKSAWKDDDHRIRWR
jgi:hypothetical protein